MAPARGVEFTRYLAVSGLGFAVDFSLLVFGVEVLSLPLFVANTISFICGVVVVYIGSIRWAFDNRKLTDKQAEFMIFCAIGIVGLGVNQIALWFGAAALALPYALAKIGAAGASFLSNYLMRKAALF